MRNCNTGYIMTALQDRNKTEEVQLQYNLLISLSRTLMQLKTSSEEKCFEGTIPSCLFFLFPVKQHTEGCGDWTVKCFLLTSFLPSQFSNMLNMFTKSSKRHTVTGAIISHIQPWMRTSGQEENHKRNKHCPTQTHRHAQMQMI